MHIRSQLGISRLAFSALPFLVPHNLRQQRHLSPIQPTPSHYTRSLAIPSKEITLPKMPLFGSRREPSPPPAPAPTQKSGLFSRRRSSSPHAATTTTHHHRHSSSASRSGTSTNNTISSGFFSRSSNGDPSITNAKQSLANAEAAEREADRALAVARSAVREARDHVARLEREAAEE